MRICIVILLFSINFDADGHAYKIRFDKQVTPDRIVCSHGTAFVLGDRIYTAYHVAKGNGKPFIFDGRQWRPIGKAVASSQNKDFIAYKNVGLQSSRAGKIKVGRCVFISSVGASRVRRYPGNVLKLRYLVGSFLALGRQDQWDLGGSGSPVVQGGKIVGMAIAKVETKKTYGIDIVPIGKILE